MADESGSNPKETVEVQRSASPFRAREDRPKKLHILIAEDNAADVGLIRMAMYQHDLEPELRVHKDGEEMLQYIDLIDSGVAPCPDFVLLDLNLPKVTGHTLLRRLRQSPVCGHVPIIIVSSSNAAEDRESAARHGATTYFCKPNNLDEFMRLGEIIKGLINTEGPTS